MALKKGDRINFATLKLALSEQRLALVESRCAKTGEYRALLCAISDVDGEPGMLMPMPLAQMITGNPFEDYVDPTMDKLPKVRKGRHAV